MNKQSIIRYCERNEIQYSRNFKSFYFKINGQNYRISNHSVCQSNKGAFRGGKQIRPFYHGWGDFKGREFIAKNTRVISIHQALLAGKRLNRFGDVIPDSAA